MGRYGAVLATLLMMGLAPAQAVPPVSACYDAYAAGRWSDTLRNCTLWASKGDPEAQTLLGILYADGKGADKNPAKAFEWFKKAAQQNHPRAWNNIGVLYANGEGVGKNFAKALEWFTKASKRGDAEAQLNIGMLYARGDGVKKDAGKALQWFTKAAKRGGSVFLFRVGQLYLYGDGLKQDSNKAFEWFLKAAKQGNVNAQLVIGMLYSNGVGVKKDYIKALEWFTSAAKKGNAHAQYNVGLLYLNNDGIPQDYGKAFSWFLKAANQGDEYAQSNVGALYAGGNGVKKDYSKAFEWFLKASSQGDALAQINIGTLYSNGNGVKQSYSKALEWFTKAAYQGDAGAYSFIGHMYANGFGAAVNPSKALDYHLRGLQVELSTGQEERVLYSELLELMVTLPPSVLEPQLKALDPPKKVLTGSRLQLNVRLRLLEDAFIVFQMRYTWTTPQGIRSVMQPVHPATSLPQAPFPLSAVNFAIELPPTLPAQGTLQARLEVLNDGILASFLDFQLDRQAPQPLERKGNLYVLAVGVNTFEDLSLPALTNAAQDPTTLLKVLTPAARSLYQKVITYPLSQDEASLERVKAAMNEIKRVARPEDTVIAFFSTHGIYTQEKQADGTLQDNYYVLLRDTVANNWAQSALSRETLLEFYRDTPGKMLLILDTCRSALPTPDERLLESTLQSAPRLAQSGGGRGLDPAGAAPLAFTGTTDGLLEAFTLPGQEKALLTASAGGKVALDRGKWGPRGALLEALVRVVSDPKRLSGQGTLDLNTLLVGVQSEVQSLTEGKQHPEFASALSWPLLAPGAP